MFVIGNQFVELDKNALEVYKVLTGAGMGLEMSGDVCDIAFHDMVEKDFVGTVEFKDRSHVEFYVRFRDDILVCLAGTPESRRAFCSELKRRSSFSKLKIESIHKSEAIMLDLKDFQRSFVHQDTKVGLRDPL